MKQTMFDDHKFIIIFARTSMTAKGVREKVDQAYGIGMDMEIFQTKKAFS